LLAPLGKSATILTGKQLETAGFNVTFTKDYDGNIYEIREID
jgi:hypothetical protein